MIQRNYYLTYWFLEFDGVYLFTIKISETSTELQKGENRNDINTPNKQLLGNGEEMFI